jgi:hypothetical protein
MGVRVRTAQLLERYLLVEQYLVEAEEAVLEVQQELVAVVKSN